MKKGVMTVKNYNDFIENLADSNVSKIAKSYRKIGEYDYTNCTSVDVEQIILSIKPKGLKSVITACYVLGLYAEFLDDENLKRIVSSLDKKKIWSIAKTFADKKFVSKKEFDRIYTDVGFEEFNAFYQQTLFKAVYEGIYCEDMSVIKNLRASDINNNMVKLHRDDGVGTYDLKISESLATDLKELAEINYTEKRNRWGNFRIETVGKYADSVFKTENRNGTAENIKFTYYRILRKISKEYVGHELLPLNLYISGIMYRIKQELKKHDISLTEAFNDVRYDKTVNSIIEKELQKSNYNIILGNFRALVDGFVEHIDEE